MIAQNKINVQEESHSLIQASYMEAFSKLNDDLFAIVPYPRVEEKHMTSLCN